MFWNTNVPDNGQFQRWPRSQGHIFFFPGRKILSQEILIFMMFNVLFTNRSNFINILEGSPCSSVNWLTECGAGVALQINLDQYTSAKVVLVILRKILKDMIKYFKEQKHLNYFLNDLTDISINFYIDY